MHTKRVIFVLHVLLGWRAETRLAFCVERSLFVSVHLHVHVHVRFQLYFWRAEIAIISSFYSLPLSCSVQSPRSIHSESILEKSSVGLSEDMGLQAISVNSPASSRRRELWRGSSTCRNESRSEEPVATSFQSSQQCPRPNISWFYFGFFCHLSCLQMCMHSKTWSYRQSAWSFFLWLTKYIYSLPSDVTSASSLTVFRNRLKTYLFSRSFPSWLFSVSSSVHRVYIQWFGIVLRPL